jgi:hypothetical protein
MLACIQGQLKRDRSKQQTGASIIGDRQSLIGFFHTRLLRRGLN